MQVHRDDDFELEPRRTREQTRSPTHIRKTTFDLARRPSESSEYPVDAKIDPDHDLERGIVTESDMKTSSPPPMVQLQRIKPDSSIDEDEDDEELSEQHRERRRQMNMLWEKPRKPAPSLTK